MSKAPPLGHAGREGRYPSAVRTGPEISTVPSGAPTPSEPPNHTLPPDTTFVAHAVLVSLLTAFSRLFGLARDLVIGYIFGVSAVASAFAAAFAIPNLFRRLFGEGALAASFVPEYAQLIKRDKALAERFASLVMGVLAAVTGAIALVGELLILALLAAAPSDPERDLFFRLSLVMLPYMPLVCAAAIVGGMLQVHKRFTPTAASPIVLNTCMIAAGLLWSRVFNHTEAHVGAAFAIAWAVLVAGVIQIAWSLVALRPFVRWRRAFEGTRQPAQRVKQRFLPAVLGMGTLQINAFLDMLIAMWPTWVGPTVFGIAYPLNQESMSVLFYSQRLYQFPLGVFGIAVATAVFPALARTADEPAAFMDTLRRGVRLSLFIGLPASAGLWLIGDPLIASLYTAGDSAFRPSDVQRAAAVLAGYAPAIWAYSLNHVLTRAFYARGDTATPMKVAVLAMVLNFTLNIALIWPLREAGLAWATSISAVVQCAALAVILHRRLHEPVLDNATRRAVAASVALTLAMTALVALLLRLLPQNAAWNIQVLRLVAANLLGAAAYLGLAWLTRREELRWLIKRK